MLRLALLTVIFVVTFGKKKLHWSTSRGVHLDKVDGQILKNQFDAWKAEFDKSYTNSEEEARHFLTFLDNWSMVIEFNDNANESYTMGLNQFADLNPFEFRQYIHGGQGSCLKGRTNRVWKRPASTGVVANPASVDWTTKGVVTQVKNQGQCGSCWAFAATGSLECRSAIATGKLVSLSEQQLMDCSTAEGNAGCNGGLAADAFTYVQKEGGLCSEQEYPYQAKDGNCKASSCGTKYDPITGHNGVPRDSSMSMETAAAAGCVSVAIEADQNAFQFYESGIMAGTCGANLDHGVLLVGYGEEAGKKYWKVKNSWGTSWGERGYIRMCKECGKDNGEGECGILSDATYPLL